LDFVVTVEISVLVAIAIEVFALYKHVKLESRMDEHIQNTADLILRSDEVIKVLDEHMMKFDEHMVRLDEHVNRLYDLIWKSYLQRTEKGFEETTSRQGKPLED